MSENPKKVELLPCNLCGCTKIHARGNMFWVYMYCTSCGRKSYTFAETADAIRDWNALASLTMNDKHNVSQTCEELRSENAALKAQIGELVEAATDVIDDFFTQCNKLEEGKILIGQGRHHRWLTAVSKLQGTKEGEK